MKNVLKTLIIFFIYFLFMCYVPNVFTFFGINEILATFLSDLIFLIIILIFYKSNLKKDFISLKNNYTFKKLFKIIILGVLLISIVKFIIPIIGSLISYVGGYDINQEAINSIYSKSKIYTIFKTIIFCGIVDEILFKESIRDIIKNNVLFVILSSIIYTIFIVIFSSNTGNVNIFELLNYFLSSIIICCFYLKNKDNVLLIILIKFIYNLIPLTIMLLGI